MLNEITFRLRSLVLPSTDKYLAVFEATRKSLEDASNVHLQRAERLYSKAARMESQAFDANGEARRAQRIADRIASLID